MLMVIDNGETIVCNHVSHRAIYIMSGFRSTVGKSRTFTERFKLFYLEVLASILLLKYVQYY